MKTAFYDLIYNPSDANLFNLISNMKQCLTVKIYVIMYNIS